MNYSADKPIDTMKQDLLGRASFSRQLGKAIYEYDGEEGLVVGLFGKWGTGKTSIINMAIEEINIQAESNKNKPMIIKFSPWNYSDKDNLISLFFQSLKNKLDISDNEVLKKKIGQVLSDYSGAIDALSIVPIVGAGLAPLLKTLVQAQGAKLIQDIDLDKCKANLKEVLIEANNKIIVVIDDIDRLSNLQIRDIFQLVKQVGDFPNIIYVLMMDRNVVCRALNDVHNIDGNEYLEKIIQVPFEIPEIRKSKLNNIFFSKIDQIIGKVPQNIILDDDYWGDVFYRCIEPYIKNLRDVNRVVNAFRFRYGFLYAETSFEDIMAITTIEVLEPKLYKWISNNKDALCRTEIHSFSSMNRNNEDYYKLYYNQFEKMKINPDRAINFLSTIFPAFATDINKYTSYRDERSIRGDNRIAHEEKFELYFIHDLDDIKVSRSTVNSCIFELGIEALGKSIEKINEQGHSLYFLEEIESLVNKVPNNRLGLLASAILNIIDKIKGEDLSKWYMKSANSIAESLIMNLISKVDKETERFEIIKDAVKNANKFKLGTIANIINRIELAYGRLAGDSEWKEGQIISLEHLSDIEKIYTSKISIISKKEILFDINNFGIAFYLWQCFDEDKATDYLVKLLKNEEHILRFICSIAIRWKGSNSSGWSFNLESFSKYISNNKVYDVIQKLDKRKLGRFSDVEQIKLASFALNYNTRMWGRANEFEAQKLIDKWKEEVEKI
ncbi:NTPase [Veillonella denticariosi JCM 15641]|uniref:NTPase n=1 Tax=Veillonella denticariosi JCM 15641 TaxID=1298594 RepID=A0A2S7Z7S8_9FIRM|nr:P-loop NTPase fold protein [Veillonella denticariosi]PQL19310.1 NTPase [Veillonella denticariosi JCM 15641]